MAGESGFPLRKDRFGDFDGSASLADNRHSDWHNGQGRAIENMQNVIGATEEADSDAHEFRLRSLRADVDAVRDDLMSHGADLGIHGGSAGGGGVTNVVDLPLGIADPALPGISTSAAPWDHRHPTTGLATDAEVTAVLATAVDSHSASADVHHPKLHDWVDHIVGSARIFEGLDAAKPAAAYQGRLYLTSDTSKLFKDTGSVWADTGILFSQMVDAKGDLIVGSASDAVTRLGSSAVNGQVLTVDTTTGSGLKWAAAGASTSTGNSLWVGYGIYETIKSLVTNEAMFVPFWCDRDITITKLRIRVATSSGSIELALYDTTGTRISTSYTGLIACPAASNWRDVTVTATPLVAGNRYFYALWVNNGLATFGVVDGFGYPGSTVLTAQTGLPAAFTPAALPSIGGDYPNMLGLPS